MQSCQVQRPDKSFIRLLLLAALLRLNKVLQANAFDFSPLPQLRVCLPTLTRSLQYTHTQSSDMEPGTRKIFTCVEEVNKCSVFTYWDHKPSSFRLERVWGRRVDEMRRGASVCHMKERNVSMLRNGKCWWNCQINTLSAYFKRNCSTPQWAFGQKAHEDTLHPEQIQENRQMSAVLHAYRLNHLCVHSVLMNQTQKRALKSWLILALMFLHIDHIYQS